MTVVLENDGLVVHHGHAIDVLRTLPAESVHCVVTSPPYFSLRDYGIPPTVWGGDAGHSHVFEAPAVRQSGGVYLGKTRWQHNENGRGEEQPGDRRQRLEEQEFRVDGHPEIAAGTFCACGAWCGALGLEPTPDLFVEHIVELFREVRRVLRRDGTLWLNLGDSYAASATSSRVGHEGKHAYAGAVGQPRRVTTLKPKDRLMIPARVALALQADGWWLRDEIVWAKGNPMPSSITDRTAPAHEMIYLLAKSGRYFFDPLAIAEPTSATTNLRVSQNVARQLGSIRANGSSRADRPMKAVIRSPKVQQGRETRNNQSFVDATALPVATRNKRSVWPINTEPYPDAHFATFPTKLVEPMILAGTSAKGVCPECGAPWVRVEGDPVPDAGRGSGNKERHVASDGDRGRLNTHVGSAVPWQPTAANTVGWRPSCRHGGRADDLEIIRTPVGQGQGPEYHRSTHGGSGTGRRGLDRKRKVVEGTRSIYRWEQRAIAEQLRQSEHRAEMAASAGSAFEHYVRTDRSGARAVPPELLNAWLAAGWVTWPERDEPEPPAPVPATVLDPFAGSGTTGLVEGQQDRGSRPAGRLVERRTEAPQTSIAGPVVSGIEAGSNRPADGGASPSGSLGKAERLILAALAGYPTGLTREQLAFLAGYHPRTPGFANAVGKLRSGGLVSPGWPATIVSEGYFALSDAGVAPMTAPPLEAWMSRFGKAERLIMQHVLDAHPKALERQELADLAGYHPRTPGFANALGKLRGLGLLDGYALHPDFARLIGR